MTNPFFLSLLMAVSNQNNELEKQLSDFSFLMENTQKALRTFREGMQTFQTGFSCFNHLKQPQPVPDPAVPESEPWPEDLKGEAVELAEPDLED